MNITDEQVEKFVSDAIYAETRMYADHYDVISFALRSNL